MKKVLNTDDLMGCAIDELKGLIMLRAKLTLKGDNEEIELTGMEKVESALTRFINNGVMTEGSSPKGIRLLDKRLIIIPQIESLTIEE